MTKLLLDYPWPLGATLDARSDGYRVLKDFQDLVHNQKLIPARFAKREELNALRGRNGTAAAAIYRFCDSLVSNDGEPPLATPILAPDDLDRKWKCALRREMGDFENWRTPQIIVPEKRRRVWPRALEVEIQCEGGQPRAVSHRVLASLSDYGSHKFAIADRDPWRNLEWIQQPGAGARTNHPCRLPRPPCLHGVPIEQLVERLGDARKKGWEVNGAYYFIPKPDYDPTQIAKEQWRKGYAFPRQSESGWKGPCLTDYENQQWRWDMKERHWDVQRKKEYIRVNHDGVCLGRRPY